MHKVDEYIKTFPSEVQKILDQVRETIKKAAPEAAETIAYRMPAYKLNGKYIIFFAAFKAHIGLYPLPDAIEEFKVDLTKYKHAKGSVQFPIDQPMPFELIERIVRFIIKENDCK